MKLGFIGTGNLATAILKGVVGSGLIDVSEIAIYDIFSEKTAQLEKELGVRACSCATQIAAECENVVITVKPNDFADLIG